MRTKRKVGGLNPKLGAALVGLILSGCQIDESSRTSSTGSAVGSGTVNLSGRISEPAKELLKSSGLWMQYQQSPETAVRQIPGLEAGQLSEEVRLPAAELVYRTASRHSDEDPKLALGWFLAAAEIATASLKSGSDDEAMRDLYNAACTQVAVLGHSQATLLKGESLTVEGPFGAFGLRFRTSHSGRFSPAYFDELIPADEIDLKDFVDHEVREGLGGVVVGQRKPERESAATAAFYPDLGLSLPVTATVDIAAKKSERRSAAVTLHDALHVSRTEVAGETWPLAADFTAPLGMISDLEDPRKVGLDRMFHPDHYLSQVDLIQLEPFQKDKMPVILVHGLSKSPTVWRKVLNEMRAEPEIRKHFQFLLFRYPTGFPAPYCGALLRGKIDAFQLTYDPRGENEAMRQTVLVGKSLGGLASSLQVRESGDELRKLFFVSPLESLDLPEHEAEVLRRIVHFEANPAIRRVVFMGTPHQGTEVADKGIVKIGDKLIKFSVPDALGVATVPPEALTDFGRNYVASHPDSVKNLRSHNEVCEAIVAMPFHRGLTIHSIVGKITTGELVDSNDKMVPYWSSHLDEAVSEVVVPCKHGDLTTHPDSIRELRRILRLHLAESPTAR